MVSAYRKTQTGFWAYRVAAKQEACACVRHRNYKFQAGGTFAGVDAVKTEGEPPASALSADVSREPMKDSPRALITAAQNRMRIATTSKIPLPFAFLAENPIFRSSRINQPCIGFRYWLTLAENVCTFLPGVNRPRSDTPLRIR